jgi:hypothetical protein
MENLFTPSIEESLFYLNLKELEDNGGHPWKNYWNKIQTKFNNSQNFDLKKQENIIKQTLDFLKESIKYERFSENLFFSLAYKGADEEIISILQKIEENTAIEENEQEILSNYFPTYLNNTLLGKENYKKRIETEIKLAEQLGELTKIIRKEEIKTPSDLAVENHRAFIDRMVQALAKYNKETQMSLSETFAYSIAKEITSQFKKDSEIKNILSSNNSNSKKIELIKTRASTIVPKILANEEIFPSYIKELSKIIQEEIVKEQVEIVQEIIVFEGANPHISTIDNVIREVNDEITKRKKKNIAYLQSFKQILEQIRSDIESSNNSNNRRTVQFAKRISDYYSQSDANEKRAITFLISKYFPKMKKQTISSGEGIIQIGTEISGRLFTTSLSENITKILFQNISIKNGELVIARHGSQNQKDDLRGDIIVNLNHANFPPSNIKLLAEEIIEEQIFKPLRDRSVKKDKKKLTLLEKTANEVKEKREQQQKQQQSRIEIRITNKDYQFYDPEFAFHGGSLGPTVEAQLENILTLYALGGIQPPDISLLLNVIYNAGPDLLGYENKSKIELYLSSAVNLLMFDDALVNVSEWFNNNKAKTPVLHLYSLQGMLFPASLILQQVYDNACKLYENLESSENSARIVNTVSQQDLKEEEKNRYIEMDEVTWKSFFEQNREKVRITNIMAVGFLNMLKKFQELLTK